MNLLKRILKTPLVETAKLLGVSLVAFIVFTYISLTLMRFMCAASYNDNIKDNYCRGTDFQMICSRVLNDFEFLSRVAIELLVLVLISQIIYRLAKKLSK